MSMTEKQVLDPRRAGQVTRYHTWSRSREQSNGEHMWQVARILLAVWPDAPRHVLVEALMHDVGEIASGDTPFPVKRDNPEVKRGLDTLEGDARLSMALPWGVPPPVELSRVERVILKLCDLVEMWEWGLYEQNMGNRSGHLVSVRCLENVNRITLGVWSEYSEEDRYLLGRVATKVNEYCLRRLATERSIEDATVG